MEIRKVRVDVMNEREMYKNYIGKQVRLTQDVNGRLYFYSGFVNDVFSDKLLLNDRKSGDMVVAFDMIKAIQLI